MSASRTQVKNDLLGSGFSEVDYLCHHQAFREEMSVCKRRKRGHRQEKRLQSTGHALIPADGSGCLARCGGLLAIGRSDRLFHYYSQTEIQ